jgi:hypothetical protein
MNVKKGDRIELIEMKNDPDPIKKGEKGTVTMVNLNGPRDFHQINVAWDNGRQLNLLPYEDKFKVIEDK